jgi:phospholipase/carboxylesterase
MSPDPLGNVQHVSSGPAFEALGLVHRVRIPAGNGPHPTLVMVHGLQGNEDATWIFARAAGPEWLVVSPRAPFRANQGYTWNRLGTQAIDLQSYEDGLAALTRFVERLPYVYPADRSRLVMLGFSQGAALSYTLAGSHPVHGIAALSGFSPHISREPPALLKGVPVIILHGTQDDRVPVAVARENRDRLIGLGADVTYVEDNVGHKVGSAGMRALGQWLAARLERVTAPPANS